MLTCFYQMSLHHPAQSAQLWRSAMEGKLLIANPNCTTAIAAMALWPSAAQCDDNPKGVIVCRRKRRFLSHQFPTKSSVRLWIFGFQHLLKFKKSGFQLLSVRDLLPAIQACCQHSLTSCLLTCARIQNHHILLLHHMDPMVRLQRVLRVVVVHLFLSAA